MRLIPYDWSKLFVIILLLAILTHLPQTCPAHLHHTLPSGIMMARLKAPWREVPAAVARLDPALFASADDVRAVLQVRAG